MTTKVHFAGSAKPSHFGFVACGAMITEADWDQRTSNVTAEVTCGRCERTGDYGWRHSKQKMAADRAAYDAMDYDSLEEDPS